MRNKILSLITILFFIPSFVFGAVTQNSVTWEYRNTATPGNVNGGGFTALGAGIDYSQQDTAHLTITDLAVSATNPNSVSSVLTPFDANDAGNILHITQGGTGMVQEWYQVLYVTGTSAILDRPCGKLGSTGGTAYLGGALSLPSANTQHLGATNSTVYIKNSGSGYTMYSNYATTFDGIINADFKFYGYKTTRGDDPTGLNRPLINTGAFSFPGSGTDIMDMRNLRIITQVAAGASLGSFVKLTNVSSINSSGTAGRPAFTLNSTNFLIFCEAQSYAGHGISSFATGRDYFYGCYIHDCADEGLRANEGVTVINCIFRNNDSNSGQNDANILAAAANDLIVNNTFYGTPGKDGYGISGNTASAQPYLLAFNNIFSGFTTAISFPVFTNQGGAFDTCGNVDYNCFFNNTTDTFRTKNGSNNTTVNPQLVNPMAGDFRIGGNLRGLGYPQNIISSNSVTSASSVICTNALDLGAVQRQEITNTWGGAN